MSSSKISAELAEKDLVFSTLRPLWLLLLPSGEVLCLRLDFSAEGLLEGLKFERLSFRAVFARWLEMERMPEEFCCFLMEEEEEFFRSNGFCGFA